MSGQPDPKPERAEKRSRRSRDPLRVKNATLADRECWGCGREGANGHHLIPKDFTKPGPDADWNTVTLCGTGTAGCHGAYHGNPYTPILLGGKGERITPSLVKARIVARLLHEPRRLRAIFDFLDTSMLREQFFRRQLGMSARDLDDLLRRYA